MAMPALADQPTHFSGSYAPDDVHMLLQPVSITPIDVVAKERLIQGGNLHYSEMISAETAPDAAYLEIFDRAFEAGAVRMATDTARLAHALKVAVGTRIAVVSLVRAGLPLGVLLKRALGASNVEATHYGVSIIRDRGIDHVALDHILSRHEPSTIVFVDGWTGKGAIAGELQRTLSGAGVEPRLVVLADPCGCAWLAASGDDWLIPSGILGGVVSGLVSRSVLNDEIIASGGFHGTVDLTHLAEHDVSRQFVDRIWAHMASSLQAPPAVWNEDDRRRHSTASKATVARIVERFGVANLNRIKPGIAEATRAVLRRMPERVFISDLADPDLAALVHLAQERNVPLETLGGGVAPYRAVTLIGRTA